MSGLRNSPDHNMANLERSEAEGIALPVKEWTVNNT